MNISAIFLLYHYSKVPSTKRKPKKVKARVSAKPMTGRAHRVSRAITNTDVMERSLANVRICSSHDWALIFSPRKTKNTSHLPELEDNDGPTK